MGWGGAEIGWQANPTDSDEHELSGTRSARIGCEYSTRESAVVFRLERESIHYYNTGCLHSVYVIVMCVYYTTKESSLF